MNKPHVFLSYSHRDREKAQPIVNALLQANISVFFDQSLDLGDNWEQLLTEKLQQSQLLIVLVSPNSIQSTYVAKEYGYFVQQNKLVLPVLIEGAATDIPFALQRFPHVDLREEANFVLVVKRAKELLEHGYLIESSGKKQITITFDADKDTDISKILNQITKLKGTHGVRIIESDY